jgi:hypothetical protein
MENCPFQKMFIVFLTSFLLLTGCAATPKIPPEEQQYIDGTMVEGGAFSFRLEDAGGGIMTFSGYHDAEYVPDDFHALYGDRLGVTYGRVMGMDKEKNVAVKVVLLKAGAGRLEIQSPAVGIIREAGMTRHKIHLPDVDVTAIMLKGKTVSLVPEGWKPEAGDKVKIYFSEEPGRFMQKTFYNSLDLQSKGPVNISDHKTRGVVKNVAPGSLTLRLVDGRIEKFFRGSETGYLPIDHNIIRGDTVYVTYYRKLMGDRSVRPTAILVEMIK